MLAQDIDYFGDKAIPCSSSGFHTLTIDDYYEYHTEGTITFSIYAELADIVDKP
jgi:hypothetical protein